MFGLYITIGVLVAVLLLIGAAIVRPQLRKYRVIIKRVDPQKKRRSKTAKKKKKSVWIKVM